MKLLVANNHSEVYKMESVPGSSGIVSKSFRSNKRKAVDMDLTAGEGQAGQGSDGSPTGELQQPEGQKIAKTTRLNQDLHMAALKSAAEAFKHMSKSIAEKSRVLKDANDDALFSRPGRQPDAISEAYFKLREEQAYLERQKYVMKLRKELSRSTQIPPMITIDEEETEE